MKFSILYVLSFFLTTTNSFKWNSNNPETRSLSYLLRDIETRNIDKLYVSNDLTKVYYKENKLINDNNEDNTLSRTLYKRTILSPAIIPKVLDSTESAKVESFIMEYNPEQGFQIAPILDNFFVGTIIFITLRILLSGFIRGGSPTSGMMPPNPFSPFMKRPNDDIKINLEKSNITLASWAGSPEVSEECFEIISYMRNSTQYKLAGAELPKGILLEGPPGTGKTLIAKAIASETNATFISVSASEFVELFVGMGAAKVRSLFEMARENTPAIIFIDEIDSVGKQRGSGGFNGGNDEREQTLNQILAEMDGFESNEDILVIAATNRKDILDQALLRPGRFDRIVYVPLPDKESRKAILQIYLDKKKTSTDENEKIQLDILAEMTQGFSGAQIKNLVNEAAIYAARDSRIAISQIDIENALEKLVVGIVKKIDTRDIETRKRVAIHELGHAFLAYYFREYFELTKVTIQSTYNGAGGYTLFKEKSNIEGLYTKDLLKKRLMVALGGKAAEFIFYGEEFISLGAIQDLKEANGLAKRMISNYGMGNYLEVFYDTKQDPSISSNTNNQPYSDKRLEEIDNESLFLLNEAYAEVIAILLKYRENIEKVLDILLKLGSLTQPEFERIITDFSFNIHIND
jgi:cell division protease FtsH